MAQNKKNTKTQEPEANASADSSTESKIPEVNMRSRIRQKTGGRQKGSENKVTKLNKLIITDMLQDYHDSGLMAQDFMELEPKDRISCAEKMMQYVLPKMQATSVDFGNAPTKITIEQELRTLSADPDENS